MAAYAFTKQRTTGALTPRSTSSDGGAPQSAPTLPGSSFGAPSVGTPTFGDAPAVPQAPSSQLPSSLNATLNPAGLPSAQFQIVQPPAPAAAPAGPSPTFGEDVPISYGYSPNAGQSADISIKAPSAPMPEASPEEFAIDTSGSSSQRLDDGSYVSFDGPVQQAHEETSAEKAANDAKLAGQNQFQSTEETPPPAPPAPASGSGGTLVAAALLVAKFVLGIF